MRIIFALLLALIGYEANAQQILVERPPTYRHGETYPPGKMVAQGVEFVIQQKAATNQNGVTFIVAEARPVSPQANNVPTIQLLTRTDRWEQHMLIPGVAHYEQVSTTCSYNDIYPLWLNKAYSCEAMIKITAAGKTPELVRVQTSMRVAEVHYTTDRRIEKICVIIESTMPGSQRDLTCTTPDMKWLIDTRPAPKR